MYVVLLNVLCENWVSMTFEVFTSVKRHIVFYWFRTV